MSLAFWNHSFLKHSKNFHVWFYLLGKSYIYYIGLSLYYQSSVSWCKAHILGFPDSSVGKESVCNARDLGSIPGLGRSPGEGKGYPLQYSGLENSMDWIVHEVAKSPSNTNEELSLCTCYAYTLYPNVVLLVNSNTLNNCEACHLQFS